MFPRAACSVVVCAVLVCAQGYTDPNGQAREVPVGFCTSSPVSSLLLVPNRRQKEVRRDLPRAKGSLTLCHRQRRRGPWGLAGSSVKARKGGQALSLCFESHKKCIPALHDEHHFAFRCLCWPNAQPPCSSISRPTATNITPEATAAAAAALRPCRLPSDAG